MVLNITGFRSGFSRMSAPAKVFLVFLILVFFLMFSSIFATLAAVPLFGYSFIELVEILNNPSKENLAIIKYFQIVQSVFVFIFPALTAAWLFSRNSITYLQAGKKPDFMGILIVLLTLLACIPFLNLTTVINARLDLPEWLDFIESRMISFEESAEHLTVLFLDSSGLQQLTVNMLMIAVLPAVGEELLFRGVFQRLFSEWTKSSHAGIFLAAFIFSFFHFQFFGFLPRLILGIYFGYLLFWSKTVWLPIAAHFFNNGIAVLYYHFSSDTIGETRIDSIGATDESYFLAYISLALASVLIILTYLQYRGKKKSRE